MTNSLHKAIYTLKFIYLFILFCILCNTLCAQSKLSGKVSNSSNNAVAFAGITLQNLNSNQNQSVKTDSEGYFSFKNLTSGKYLLTTSFIGYKRADLNLTITKDTIIEIVLNVSNTQLKEVVVTANKPTIENTADKLVYNVSTSVMASGTDALTALSQVPGIKVNDNSISIAGKGAIRAMINGRMVQLSGIDLMRYLRSIPASQVSKIELIKNPSASYDADGNAGLINIIIKRSKKQGYSGTVQVNTKRWFQDPAVVYGTSNFEAINANASLNYNSAKLSAFGSVNFDQDHHLEGFETDLFYPKQTWKQTDTGNYRHHNLNFTAGADYKISPKTTIGFLYMGGRDVYDGSDHVNNPVYNNSGGLDSTLKTYATYYPVAITNSINLNSTINFDTTGKRLLLNADYFNYYRTDHSDFESNSFLSNNELNPSSNTRYHNTNKQNINIYTFKADAEIPTKFVKVAFGGKLSFINNYSNAFYYNKENQDDLVYNTDLSNEFNYKENTQALYINLNKEQGEWKYQAGVRGELTETDGYSYTLRQSTINKYFKLFPSVSITYQPDKDNTLAFTYGRRINRPTFWNLNPYKSLYTAYSYGEGNPYLQPEYSNNFELSHNYKNILTSALFLNITDNGFNNVTIARPDTNLVYTIPINFIKTYRYGISETLSLPVFTWLDNNEQLTFYHSNALSDINTISNIEGFGLYLATNNNIYFNKDKTFAGAVNFWYQFPEIDHIGRSDAYYKLDLGVKTSAFKKKVDISLTLNDLLRSSASSVSTIINGVPEKLTNFQLNRYAQLSISYRFGNNETKTGVKDTGNQDERKRL